MVLKNGDKGPKAAVHMSNCFLKRGSIDVGQFVVRWLKQLGHESKTKSAQVKRRRDGCQTSHRVHERVAKVDA
ncbi:hypothetical protein U1Q18_048506 [Sarracenia purpurea var. burkii]